MDDFGKHFESMLIAVNQSELNTPSTNKEEYVAKFAAYQTSNPLNGTLMDFVSPNSEFYYELAGLIKEIGSNEDPNLTVAQLKTLENIFADAEVLSDMEKSYLLAYSSAIKYTKSTIKSNGLVVGGIDYGGTTTALSWPCFDRVFNRTVRRNLSILDPSSSEAAGSPLLTLGAWAGLPGTLGWGVADGIYQAATGC